VKDARVAFGLSLRNKPSKDMAFPHPKSRKDQDGNGHKPNHRGVVWQLLERTVNIAGYWDGKDNVNPAKDRTFGGVTHHLVPFH